MLPVLLAATLFPAWHASGANPTDPFARETDPCGSPDPDHYRTFQWPLGLLCGAPNLPVAPVNAAGAWNYAGAAGQPGHAVIGVLDAGPSTYREVGTVPNLAQFSFSQWQALGYYFTPLQAGTVEALGARTGPGPHTVRLFDHTDPAQPELRATAEVTSEGLWTYVNLAAPVSLLANVRYSVVVSIPPSASASFYRTSRKVEAAFPQAFGDVRVDGGALGYADVDGEPPSPDASPTELRGLADVHFRPLGGLLAKPVMRDYVVDYETTVHPELTRASREHLSPSWGPALRAQFGAAPFGHGMHVGGLLAGAWNASGTAGICRDCSLLWARRVPLADAALVRALVDAGAQLINLSGALGGGASQANRDAVAYAAEADVVFLAAAGNDTHVVQGVPVYAHVDYPASDPAAIGVAGTSLDGSRWQESEDLCALARCGSNWDAENPPDVAAPARRVLSAWYPGVNFSDWNPPGQGRNFTSCGDGLHDASDAPGASGTDGFGLCTGTSMSAPIATAVAALVRSTNPLLSRTAVRDVLVRTASNPAGDEHIGAGVVDAGAAQREALGLSAGQLVRNRLTPLFELYSAEAGDHLYTTSPQAARVAALGKPRRRFASSQDPSVTTSVTYTPGNVATGATLLPFPYELPGGAGPVSAAAFLFTTPVHPVTSAQTLRPLLRMSWVGEIEGNPLHVEHAYTTLPKEHPSSEVASFESVGYRLDGVEGYVFPASQPGAVALYRRYNPVSDDFAIFPASQLAAMNNQGYTVNHNATLFPNGVIGYVYPNVDSDGDGLIDGFETVLGTNPVAWDSDGDGQNDGQEALAYVEGSGYGDPRSAPPAQADLVIEGSATTTASSLRFDVAARNDGPAAAQDATLNVRLYSSSAFDVTSNCTVVSSAPLERRYRCSTASLPRDQRLTGAFDVVNYCGVAAPITLEVTATSATPDPQPGNNSGLLQPLACPASADMRAEASATSAGENSVRFVAGGLNAGPSPAQAPRLNVRLSSTSPFAVASPCTLVSSTGLDHRYQCGSASLAAGLRLEGTFDVANHCSLPAPITLEVSATSATPDPLPGNDTRTIQSAACPPRADLVAEASANTGTNSLHFAASGLNAGPATAQAVTLDVRLRSTSSFAVSSACRLVSNTGLEHRYRCEAASLAAGQRLQGAFEVPDYCSLRTPITFEVAAASATTDPLPGNNAQVMQGDVRKGCSPAADLGAKLDALAIGPSTFELNAYVSNSGPDAGPDAQALFEFTSDKRGWTVVPLDARCTPEVDPPSSPFSRAYRCPFGTLAPEGVVTLEPAFRIEGPRRGKLDVSARASSALPDLWPKNDLSTIQISGF